MPDDLRRITERRDTLAGRDGPGHDGGMAHPDPDRRPEVRAADADRARVAERLRCAHGEGRLDLEEFDERVTAAWAARTYGDLDALTADLPPPAPAPPARVVHPPVVHPPVPDRPAVAAWAGASVLNLVIWGVLAVSTAQWIYPWWIWVAGPWGVLLLAQWLDARRNPPAG
jgi:hypothetical protein